MRAPISNVTLHTGESVPFGPLHAERPLALNFLRHLGCLFCRESIALFRNFPDLNVVMVAMSDVEEVARFRERMESPQTYISDPNKALYEHFGLHRARLTSLMAPKVLARSIQATLRGHRPGKVAGDPLLLAGTFIINPGGEVVHSYYSESVTEYLAPAEIKRLLESVA